MKVFFSRIILFLTAAVLHATTATAALPTDDIFSSNASEPALKVDHWYKLKRAVSLQPMIADGEEETFNKPRLTLVPGTEINVLEFSPDGAFVLIGIDEDISPENPGVTPNEPVIAWVHTSDLVNAQPEFIDVEALEFFADLGIVLEDAEYAATEVARRGGGRSRRRGGRGGMTYCLRDVRITAARFTRRVPQGIPMASMAYPRYKAAGWSPISYSSSVPIGTACFFGGGRRCGKSYCGHAAIKIGSNKWKGAGIYSSPFLNSRSGRGRVPYKFHGCLVPPNDKGGSVSSRKPSVKRVHKKKVTKKKRSAKRLRYIQRY